MSERARLILDLCKLYEAVNSNPYIMEKMLNAIGITVFDKDRTEDDTNLKKVDELKETHLIYYLPDARGIVGTTFSYVAVPKDFNIELVFKHQVTKTDIEVMKPWDENRFAVEFIAFEDEVKMWEDGLTRAREGIIEDDDSGGGLYDGAYGHLQCQACKYGICSSRFFDGCIKDGEIKRCRYECPDFERKLDEG